MSHFGRLDRPTQGQDEVDLESELPSFLMDFEQRRWRVEQLNRIRIFMESAVKREEELSELLDWLTVTKESFETFERNRGASNEMASSEWIKAMESKLEKFMWEMDCGLKRLNILWKTIRRMDFKTTKKEENSRKGSVWHWWREQKVDAKAVSRIQELQPPSVESIMEDASFGTKCASELTFILEDIQKSMSDNKALSMALTFVQTGLNNLNQAFQERSKQVKEKEHLNKYAISNKMTLLSPQVDMEREMKNLEDKLTDMREQKEALLFHIHTLQNHIQHRAGPLPKSVEVYLDSQPSSNTEPVATPPTFTNNDLPPFLTLNPQPSSTCQKAPELRSLNNVLECAGVKKETGSVVQQIEKKSSNLLREFRETVFEILENSMEQDDANQPGAVNETIEKADGQNIVKLYQSLQSTMHDCFDDIMSHIRGQCKEEIIDLPLQDLSLFESELWDSTEVPPSEMLKEIGVGIKKHDKSIENAGESLKALFTKPGKQRHRHTLSQLLDMLKNISDMGKQQACKMRLTLEGMCEMHRRIQEEKPANSPLPLHQSTLMVELKPSKPKMVEQKVVDELEVIPEVVKGPNVIKELVQDTLPKSSSLIPEPQKLSPNMESVSPKDQIDRYSAEMAGEAQRLLRLRPIGSIYVINVESQRVNAKLLDQALFKRSISPGLYHLIRDIIMQTQSSVENRLCCILQRFMKHARLQHVCKILNARLLEARNLNDGHTIRQCYYYLQKVEKLQTDVTNSGYTKQDSVDLIRKNCMARMLYLFNQMKMDYGIHLAAPYCCSTQECLPFLILPVRPKKLQWSLNPSPYRRRYHSNTLPPPHFSFLSSLSPLLQLSQHHEPITERETVTHQHSRDSLWQVKHTHNCMWLASKKSAVPPLPIPTLPRLIEMDVNQDRRKARRTLEARMNGVLGQILKSRGGAEFK